MVMSLVDDLVVLMVDWKDLMRDASMADTLVGEMVEYWVGL